MAIVLDGTTGITNDGGYTGDGVVFADTTPANTLVTTTGGNVGIGTSLPGARLNTFFGTAGAPATSGSVDANLAVRLGVVSVGLDFGTYGSGSSWIQNRSASNYAVNYDLVLQPNGGGLLVGTTGPIAVSGVSGSNSFSTATSNAWALSVRHSTAGTSPWGIAVEYSASTPNNISQNFYWATDTGSQRFSVRSNGGISNFSANNVNLSDRREKTNFAPAKSYLDIICAIPVQTFNYIDQNHEEDPGLTLGVVAQDVQEVAPELVMESNWGTEEKPRQRLSIYQTDLQYALMKCIQEQQAIITALTARVEALEGAQA